MARVSRPITFNGIIKATEEKIDLTVHGGKNRKEKTRRETHRLNRMILVGQIRDVIEE